ncbi:MAG: hypothetical protein V4674_01290 [Patescibacteria group bacterium]
MRMLVWCLVLILVSTSPLFAARKRVKKAKHDRSCGLCVSAAERTVIRCWFPATVAGASANATACDVGGSAAILCPMPAHAPVISPGAPILPPGTPVPPPGTGGMLPLP